MAFVYLPSFLKGHRQPERLRPRFYPIVIASARGTTPERHSRAPEEVTNAITLNPVVAAPAQQLADHGFRGAGAVDVGGVDEVDAQVLGISEPAVRINLHHARQRLKQQLMPYLMRK